MVDQQLKPSVVLVADRTLSSPYTILFEGIFATMQTTQVPEGVMKRLVSPPMPCRDKVRAAAAPLGLRRLEAALVGRGGLAEEDVVCTTPEALDKVLGPWVEIVGISSSDPLGRGMSNTTTQNFWKGSLYTRVWTDRLLARLREVKKRFPFKVIGGGAGAWQWAADRNEAARQGIDVIFDGYGEEAGVELIRGLLEGGASPGLVTENGTAAAGIPPIRSPSLLGIIELSRGCGKGCRFCTMSRKPMAHLPADTILSDVETNVAGGLRSVVSGSEDFFRYGSRDGNVDFEKLRSLLEAMQKIQGLSFMQIDHANVTSVLQLDPGELREIRSLLTWRKKSRYLWVNLGVESANGRLVAASSPGKIAPHSPDDWEEMVREAVDRLNGAGFFPVLSLILGLPGETGSDVAASLDLVRAMARTRAAVFPIFYEPVRPGELPFTQADMRRDHLELYAACYETNFRWVPPMFWDNQRAGGVSFIKRALMRLLGKTEIRSWRRTFGRLRKGLEQKDGETVQEEIKEPAGSGC